MTQRGILDLSVITQIKPFVTEDRDIFATNLNKVLKQYCLQDGDIGEGAMGISATEVVNNHDHRSPSTRMTEAKICELRGLIERGTFKVFRRAETKTTREAKRDEHTICIVNQI
jgi:hypothetical protein